MGFVKRYVLPGLVAVVVTVAFWGGVYAVRAYRAQAELRDRYLLAVVKIVEYNLNKGKLDTPPPDPAK